MLARIANLRLLLLCCIMAMSIAQTYNDIDGKEETAVGV
jgi:hypothetical protein